MYVKLTKVFQTHIHVFFNTEPGHTEELQWEMSISLFVDSQWLLYTQPVMSVGNIADTKIRVILDAVKRKSQDCQMGCC